MNNKKFLNLAIAGTIALTGVGTGLSMGVGATSSAATSVTLPSSYGTSYNAQQLANIAALSNDQRVALKNNIAEASKKYIGVPYVYGGNDPKTGLDCSSFMQWTYKDVGIKLPRVADDQKRYTKSISLSQAQPGDFIFWNDARGNAYHVGMILDPVAKTFISEPAPGRSVYIGNYKYGFNAGGSGHYMSYGTIIPHADFNGKPAPVVTPTPTPTTTKSTPTPTTTTPTTTPPITTPPVTTPPVSKTLTFTPSADTYVDSINPGANYGGSQMLELLSNNSSKNENGYIKFPVKGLTSAGIKSAKLRIFVNADTKQGLNLIYGKSSNDWTEKGLTYNNKPTINFSSGNYTTMGKATLTKGWNEITISDSSIFSKGNSDYDFFVYAQNATINDSIQIASREDTSHAPQLIIENK